MIMRIAKIVSLRISLGGTILEMMQLRKKNGKIGRNAKLQCRKLLNDPKHLV